MYQKSKIIKWILSVVLVVSTLFTGCAAKGITGNEWVMMQESSMSDLETFTNSMDDVFSLYFMGAISDEDFVQEVNILKQEYLLLEADYQQLKEENLILPESYSYAAQKGIAGIENAREIIGEILDSAVDEEGNLISPEELSYIYMSYQQELIDSLTDYVTAYQLILQTESDESSKESSEAASETAALS